MSDCGASFEAVEDLPDEKPRGTIITIRFSVENEPTPNEIGWTKNAIAETLRSRYELRCPQLLSIITDSPGIIPPILSEELWQAIKVRMLLEGIPKPAQQGWCPGHWVGQVPERPIEQPIAFQRAQQEID